ncbi:hypothetical protein mRhiFer1_008789 [Rhinolophus ferrumequinum]|uniref:Uncharacterized protein n=1 Tax=Rhinolophus ferrumequinum TaxID=59479 RepID=A0A7J7TMF4_RHIFE|nr:hypothetical protein mRhiFer1_008789 [Rhinolophus ferrumequinum]
MTQVRSVCGVPSVYGGSHDWRLRRGSVSAGRSCVFASSVAIEGPRRVLPSAETSPGADAEHTGLRGAAVKRHLFLLFQPQRPHHVRAGRHLKRTPPLGGCQAVPGVCSEASKVFQMGKWVLRVGDPSL